MLEINEMWLFCRFKKLQNPRLCRVKWISRSKIPDSNLPKQVSIKRRSFQKFLNILNSRIVSGHNKIKQKVGENLKIKIENAPKNLLYVK